MAIIKKVVAQKTSKQSANGSDLNCKPKLHRLMQEICFHCLKLPHDVELQRWPWVGWLTRNLYEAEGKRERRDFYIDIRTQSFPKLSSNMCSKVIYEVHWKGLAAFLLINEPITHDTSIKLITETSMNGNADKVNRNSTQKHSKNDRVLKWADISCF